MNKDNLRDGLHFGIHGLLSDLLDTPNKEALLDLHSTLIDIENELSIDPEPKKVLTSYGDTEDDFLGRNGLFMHSFEFCMGLANRSIDQIADLKKAALEAKQTGFVNAFYFYLFGAARITEKVKYDELMCHGALFLGHNYSYARCLDWAEYEKNYSEDLHFAYYRYIAEAKEDEDLAEVEENRMLARKDLLEYIDKKIADLTPYIDVDLCTVAFALLNFADLNHKMVEHGLDVYTEAEFIKKLPELMAKHDIDWLAGALSNAHERFILDIRKGLDSDEFRETINGIYSWLK